MPLIKPISDLRNKSHEISELCHKENQPVFITKNGEADLVVMSNTYYEVLSHTLELYEKLGEAEILDANGEKGITHHEMMKRLKKRINE